MNPIWVMEEHPHGVVLVIEADFSEGLPSQIVPLLSPEDRSASQAMPPPRAASFALGRAAMGLALRHIARPVARIPSDDRGAPVLPAGLSGSLSHKRKADGRYLAAALLVQGEDQARVGVDIELLAPARPAIASMVLTPEEIEAIEGLAEDEAWRSTVLRFSIKEAVYKAIDPFLRRYVGFGEARVELGEPVRVAETVAVAEVSLSLRECPQVVRLEVSYCSPVTGVILCSARASRETFELSSR